MEHSQNSETTLFIINPVSGTKQAVLFETGTLFREHSFFPDIYITKPDLKELKSYIADKNYKTAIIYGGDGTLTEVAKILWNHNPTITILPLPGGTMNVFHKSLKLDSNYLTNLKHFLEGRLNITPRHFLQVNNMLSLLSVSFGHITEAIIQTKRSEKNTLGNAAYFANIIKSFGTNGTNFKLTTNIHTKTVQFKASNILISLYGFDVLGIAKNLLFDSVPEGTFAFVYSDFENTTSQLEPDQSTGPLHAAFLKSVTLKAEEETIINIDDTEHKMKEVNVSIIDDPINFLENLNY
ncbi:NAD(+)/NADH kinase [Candidatus Dojkabacteria bacterium]|uniref:NAD(+)/NADH kinase n=1 Tax=Candidatus Dojkabacteria bacterium TaxID=2099670 RepID=A0A955RKP6_9BACT|nr:NAD(+)/NADH kinase [Candidatus Dojkabacteria bacterium]